MIYFDSAATTLQKPQSVYTAVVDAMKTFGGAGRGGHKAALKANRCVYNTRVQLANLFSSTPEQVVFTQNSTESLNICINGLLDNNAHVITTVLEHNSILRPLYKLNKMGMGLSFIDCDKNGKINYNDFYKNLKKNTRAVVCTHASNVINALVDIEFISNFCRENNLLFILDTSQTAGVYKINTDKLGISALCFTGHKSLYAPQGTGGIIIGENIKISPQKVGGSGIRSFDKIHPDTLPESLEAGTLNAHGIAGLSAGIDFIESTGVDNIRKHELMLAERFYKGVSNVDNIKFCGKYSKVFIPLVALNISSMDSAQIAYTLDDKYNICIRAGVHCAPLLHMALGTQNTGAARFSFSYFNTIEEVDFAINAVKEIANSN